MFIWGEIYCLVTRLLVTGKWTIAYQPGEYICFCFSLKLQQLCCRQRSMIVFNIRPVVWLTNSGNCIYWVIDPEEVFCPLQAENSDYQRLRKMHN